MEVMGRGTRKLTWILKQQKRVLMQFIHERKKQGVKTDARNFMLTSKHTWHMASRWYTSDLVVVTAAILICVHCETNNCIAVAGVYRQVV